MTKKIPVKKLVKAIGGLTGFKKTAFIINWPTDDRQEVLRTEYPYNAICLLRIKAANGERLRGTGFFISPRCVITAGHCVFYKREWINEIEVVPGALGTLFPYGSAVSSNVQSIEGWFKNRNDNFDYGAIILKDDTLYNTIGAKLGYQYSTDETNVEIAGYPIDKSQKPFKCVGQIDSRTPYKFFYTIDTETGNSGSPIFIERASGERVVVGLHTEGARPNAGIRIRPEMISVLKQWSKL